MNRIIVVAGASVALITAAMVRATRRAQAEAELWALATEPRQGS